MLLQRNVALLATAYMTERERTWPDCPLLDLPVRTLLNIKIIGQSSRSHGFVCVSYMHDRPSAWTIWPGFTKCHSLDGACLLLPAEATGATRPSQRYHRRPLL